MPAFLKNKWLWIGIALIIGAGLYTLYREARRHRAG